MMIKSPPIYNLIIIIKYIRDIKIKKRYKKSKQLSYKKKKISEKSTRNYIDYVLPI